MRGMSRRHGERPLDIAPARTGPERALGAGPAVAHEQVGDAGQMSAPRDQSREDGRLIVPAPGETGPVQRHGD
ncbi:MAG: hypothetical protein ACK559_14315, partial [bacterium]